jgi:dTDP-4-dehydrorhamnose reductase
MIILLTGVNGQVGFELLRALSPLGKVVGLNSQQLNLADADAIRRVVREIQPGLIVNPAAYTAVDRAESESALAFAVNGTAPGVLAEEAKKLGAKLVHFSTDYVFDGSKSSPYVETDSVNPVSVYGSSKLAGEQAIQAAGAQHLILRTSWVYGMRGKNFLLTMLRLAKERDSLRVVADQHGAPTWSRMIAETTALAIARWNDESGVYHLTNGGSTSWHGFAQAILAEYSRYAADKGWSALKVTPEAVEAIITEQYPTPAARPYNSLLSNIKLKQTFALELTGWHRALEMLLEDVATLAV